MYRDRNQNQNHLCSAQNAHLGLALLKTSNCSIDRRKHDLPCSTTKHTTDVLILSQNSHDRSQPEKLSKKTSEAKDPRQTEEMKVWWSSCVLVAALILECCTVSAAAVPMSKGDDGSLEQDTLASLLSDDMSEANPSEVEVSSKARPPRVIVVGDSSLWQGLRALHSGTGLFKRRAEEEHQDLNIPILRRDTMRCMVGRVYRPCWEV
ncbi:hypothetical protein WMY93_020742 [Mugilogobius chulae]|uniref:Melanin-concentrating hormone n=1 Tax=Mugilogobius chulae TaxID=88201 RepID=A0AAW0N8M9_9GOBI